MRLTKSRIKLASLLSVAYTLLAHSPSSSGLTIMASTQLELFSRPISVDAPPALFPRRDGHPVQPKGVSNSSSVRPIQTNK